MKTIAEKVEDVEHFRGNQNPNEKQGEKCRKIRCRALKTKSKVKTR